MLAFEEQWQEYGKRRMTDAIKTLPAGTWEHETRHDPLPFVAPDGIPIRVKMTVDPVEAYITLDFTGNIDSLPCGMNMSESTVMACGVAGVLNNLDPTLPHNWGAFSRIIVKMREGSVVGKTKHPGCASMATTNVADRVINVVQSCFAKLGKEKGMADGALGMPAAAASVFGVDWRKDNAVYVRQLIMGASGGPGHYGYDGWLGYGMPVVAGVVHLDSAEVDELALPILVDKHEFITDSGGPGQWRGAPGIECRQRPRHDPGSWGFISDGHYNVAQGVNGGQSGRPSDVWKYDINKGEKEKIDLPKVSLETLQPSEMLVSESCGGGGFGDPLDRDPEKVKYDVRAEFVSARCARDVYGVVVDTSREQYTVDYPATKALRAELRKQKEAGK